MSESPFFNNIFSTSFLFMADGVGSGLPDGLGTIDGGGEGFGGGDFNPFDDDDPTGNNPLEDAKDRVESKIQDKGEKYLKDKVEKWREKKGSENRGSETEPEPNGTEAPGETGAEGTGEAGAETGMEGAGEAGAEAGVETGMEAGAEAGMEAAELAEAGEAAAAIEGAEAAIEAAELAEAAAIAAEAAGTAEATAAAASGAVAAESNPVGWVITAACCLGCLVVILICTAIMAFSVLFGGDRESGSGGGACGAEATDVIDGLTLPYKEGKLGHEDHLTEVNPSHYVGADSSPLKFAGGGSFAPHTTEQEQWYVTSQWVGANWDPTRYHRDPIVTNPSIYAKNIHKKLILTSTETNKSVVVSIEEAGPALWVTDRDGVQYGAPPEVYKALGGSDPYTGNPADGKGKITVAFAKDQSIPLGICAASGGGGGSGGIIPKGSGKVPLYKQWDPRWGHNSYGCGKTIASAGCGVTSLAMLITYYTGKEVLPSETAKISLSHDWRICKKGTSWEAMTAMPRLYGLQSKEISWSQAKSYLKKGMPIIQSHHRGFFTNGGHFIVVTGIDSRGNYLINDPDGKHRTVATESQITASLNASWVIWK